MKRKLTIFMCTIFLVELLIMLSWLHTGFTIENFILGGVVMAVTAVFLSLLMISEDNK